MTDTIRIPRSISTLDRRLAELEGLARATDWERAAIVYAFTEKGSAGPGRGHKNPTSSSGVLSDEPLPIGAFARRGFAGLKSPDTVRQYHDAWQWAVDEGHADRALPGHQLTLPMGVKFPPIAVKTTGRTIKDPDRREALRHQAEADGVGASKVIDVASNPKAVASAIKADPELAKRLAQDPAVQRSLRYAADERRQAMDDAGERVEQQSRELRSKTPLQVLSITGDLATAREALTAALNKVKALDTDVIDPEFIGYLRESVDKVVALAQLVQLAAGNEADIDWDVELAKLAG